MRPRLAFDRPVSEETYIELVRSLPETVPNTALFAVLFSLVVAWAITVSSDPVVVSSGLAGVLLGFGRLVPLVLLRRRVRRPFVAIGVACPAERRFGAVYIAFAALLGVFAARAFQAGPFQLQLLATALVVGFAAGAAAGLSLRPWISVPSIILAVIPVVAQCVAGGAAYQLLLGLVLAMLLAGGVGSMLSRYKSETEKIGLRQLLGTLARQDPLTGLANRLALNDAYVGSRPGGSGQTLAVHCLDLDGFKQVNDRFGHPVGDVLLQQVADRLRSIVRKSDIAARLGGDEFVVLQTGIQHPSEAEFMARRVVRTLREPYLINGNQVGVGVSVGYVVARADEALGHLLGCADSALYNVKRQGGGAAAHGALEHDGNLVRLAG
jgi:diguanylate cyclase (GGDEF)-like protein